MSERALREIREEVASIRDLLSSERPPCDALRHACKTLDAFDVRLRAEMRRTPRRHDPARLMAACEEVRAVRTQAMRRLFRLYGPTPLSEGVVRL